MAENNETRKRRKKSIVWEHFTIESVGGGCRRACCKQCKQSFAYSTGSKVAGTSHLKRHIAKGTCPVLLRNQEKNQLTPYSGMVSGTGDRRRRYRTLAVQFDQARCRREIARMIIMHDYPLHMVEQPGFIAFVRNLQPRFETVSFRTVEGDCVATYLTEKHEVTRYLDRLQGKISLSIEFWNSFQSTGYVFFTAHFIDADWTLRRRLLNVFPHEGAVFASSVSVCLADWSLEKKIFSVTFNGRIGETDIGSLRALLSAKNPLILNGQLLIRNCLMRTLTSMAEDVMNAGTETIKRVRACMKQIRFSEDQIEKRRRIDNQKQWNTTYQMLVSASELQEFFTCLKEDDWKMVNILCRFLKLLFDAVSVFTGLSNPTSNIFFHEACKIRSELSGASTSEDAAVTDMAKKMMQKFEIYWNDCSFMLAIAVAMDPRFKMKLVEFSFSRIYGNDATERIKIVDEGLHELFLEYSEEHSETTKTEDSDGHFLLSNGLLDFDMYIMETSGRNMKSELDQYLEEALSPRIQDFDVLEWWKLNKLKYPTLSRMARDVLSVSVSSVSPESAFDIAGNEIDDNRSSLRPETVEAIMCAKDWLLHSSLGAPLL